MWALRLILILCARDLPNLSSSALHAYASFLSKKWYFGQNWQLVWCLLGLVCYDAPASALRLLPKPSSFARLLRCARASDAHLNPSKLRFGSLARLAFKQNTWFGKKSKEVSLLSNVVWIVLKALSITSRRNPFRAGIGIVSGYLLQLHPFKELGEIF